LVKLYKAPRDEKVKLFQVVVGADDVEYIVTNDIECNDVETIQQENKTRWKIEAFHREVKQLTGIEKCQCRRRRCQRNHICCAILVWLRLKQLAYDVGINVYQIKKRLMAGYLRAELANPTIKMSFVFSA
jgi:hypothetical protein